jgi:pentatricopeptide repeat protein
MVRFQRGAHATGVLGVLTAILLACAVLPASGNEEASLKDLESIHRQYQKACDQQDYAAALAAAEQVYEILFPEYIESLYKVTAMHCRLGRTEKAYEWLQEMLDAGFWDFGRLRGDEDFDSIRQDGRFRQMTRGAWLKQYIAMLERPERDDFQLPDQVMQTLAFKPGERVADIGTGSGYFTLPIAEAVGPEGVVWAIDIRQEMLDYVRGKLDEKGLENVRLMLVDPDDPQLPAGKVDTIVMVDTWHYIRDPEYARKMRYGLAPGGRVVVIDYRPKPWEDRPWGPPPQQQTPREELDAHFAEAGLAPVASYDFLPEQYFIIYGSE